MDLRDYYRMMAADISDEDMRKAAQILSDHIGKANAVSKHDLTLALYGKTTDSTERKAREVITELRSRAYRMLETARKLDKTNLRPVLSPEAMLGMGQGRLW